MLGKIIQPIWLPSIFLLHGNALTFLKIDTPKITSVKALAPSPRFCDHVSPFPDVNFDWENYKQKQTPNKKQTEQPQTTIMKWWFICLPPTLPHILIEWGQDNFSRHSHLEREKMSGTQQSLIHSNFKILLDICFEDTYPGGREYFLCLLSLSPFLCFFLSNHSKHLLILLNLWKQQLLDLLIFSIFLVHFYFIDFHSIISLLCIILV